MHFLFSYDKIIKEQGVILMRSAVLKGARKIEVEKKENMVGREGYILIDVLKVGICGSDIHYWV